MTIGELFPNWHEASTGAMVPWEMPLNLADDAVFFRLLGHVVHDQTDAANNRPQEFQAICNAILQDLLALQANPSDDWNLLNLQYLQFEASLVPMQLALRQGDFGAMYDWLLNGCSTDATMGPIRDFDTPRLYAFVGSEIGWIAANRGSTFTDWGMAFYYYCRRRAALFEAAVAVFEPVVRAIGEMSPIDDRVIEAKRMIANWASVYDHPAAPLLVEELEQLHARPEVSLLAKTGIAVSFATSMAARTARTSREWAAWALRNGPELGGSHVPLQLLLTQIDTVEEWDRLHPQLLAAGQLYASDLRQLGVPTRIAQATDQRSGILAPAVVKAMRFERGDDLLALLACWYDVPKARALDTGALFLVPQHLDGIVVTGASTQIVRPPDPQRMKTLVEATNRALGLAITIEGGRDAPGIADRPAQPNYPEGERFEAALRDIYRWSDIENGLIAAAGALIPIPGQPHPVQAMMAEVRDDPVLAISTSLERPGADRLIRRALLWSADNDNFSGFEVDAVQAILERSGVQCERRSGADAAADQFLAAYADDSFDLLWVAGHGEIDHWADGSTKLICGEDCAIGIDDLVSLAPKGSGRRLVVLNICDGGAAAVNGGIQRLGLAPMLACAGQATVSHLWPVRPQVASMFGALLAGQLVESDGTAFLTAFSSALRAMRGSSDDVVAKVHSQIAGLPLADRLANVDLETRNILNWGSACFFS